MKTSSAQSIFSVEFMEYGPFQEVFMMHMHFGLKKFGFDNSNKFWVLVVEIKKFNRYPKVRLCIPNSVFEQLKTITL